MARIARVVVPGACYVGKAWPEGPQKKAKIPKIKYGVPRIYQYPQCRPKERPRIMNTQLRPVPKSIAAGLCLSLLAVLLASSKEASLALRKARSRNTWTIQGRRLAVCLSGRCCGQKDTVVKKSWDYLKSGHPSRRGPLELPAIGSILAPLFFCAVWECSQS